jgi:hypothetical protein
MRKRTLEAKLADIARNYNQKPERTLRLNRIAVKRVAVLERYLELRYGRVLPDDDAGREHLVILLNHIAQNPIDPQGKMRRTIHSWAPWMDYDERYDLVERIAAKPRRYRASTLGKRLRLTEEEHEIIEAETIWAFDATAEGMKAKAKQKDRKRKKAERAAKSSGRPRGRPKSEGMPAWQAAGASSKAAYYRNLKKAAASETKNASPYKRDSYTGTELKSHPRDPIGKAGAPQARRPVSGIGVPKSEISVDKRRRPKAPPPTHLARAIARARHTIQ